MKKSSVIPLLTVGVCVASGLFASLFYKSSKLHFAGDGGGTDEIIVFKYMLVSLLMFIAVLAIVTIRSDSVKKAAKICGVSFATGLITVIVFGTLLTGMSIHTACDEYGSASGECIDESSKWSPLYYY
jgi:ABC-type transport system involved in multi-copper enzyme maturation permease subunit